MTTKNRRIFWLGLLLAVFLAGFVPQYLELRKIRSDLRLAEFKNRLGQLRERVALIYVETNQKNYGIAAQHSTEFFNQLRQVTNETSDQTLKKALEDLLAIRDTITAHLAKGDPAVVAEVQTLLTKTYQSTTGRSVFR